jgi:hypothetical protein
MTPRQFHLLWDRHREDLLHREMVQAFTTAAVINHSFSPPKERAQAGDFMPNWKPERLPVRQEPQGEAFPEEVVDDYRATRAHLAALFERYQATGIADPYLVKIGLVSDGG